MSDEMDLHLTEAECLHLMHMSIRERPLDLDWLIGGTRLRATCTWAIEELKKIRSEK